jgi:hypothetical protein
MAVAILGYKKFWADKRTSLKSEYQALISNYLHATSSIKSLFKVLCNTESLASNTPASERDSTKWNCTVKNAEENKVYYWKVLTGMTLLNALYGTYTVILNKVNAVLRASRQTGKTSNDENGFIAVRRRTRHGNKETIRGPKKEQLPKHQMHAEVAKDLKFFPLGKPELYYN